MSYQEEQREIDRKRNTLVLIMDYLRMHGYHDSVERLQNETNKTLSNYSAADNIDLATIVQEFEEFYRIKFGKTPKLIRKRPADGKFTAI
jgi:katanin p60 ATPase-containing subunit A1